jgi:dTDP-4-dehydrorhamnose reductase
MRILLLGASGFLGQALFDHFRQRHEVTGTTLTRPGDGLVRLDLRDGDAVAALARRPFDLIVHAAGLVDLVAAERDPELSRAVNARPVHHLVERADRRLVYLSTDNVFPGTRRCFTENDPTAPINVYGRSKVEAENQVVRRADNTVIRLPLLIDGRARGNKFLARFAGPVTPAQTDVVTNPVYVPDLLNDVERLWRLPGVVHYGGADAVSRFALMSAVQRAIGLPTVVTAVRGRDVPPGELRPRRLVLRSVRHPWQSRGLGPALLALAEQWSSTRPPDHDQLGSGVPQ